MSSQNTKPNPTIEFNVFQDASINSDISKSSSILDTRTPSFKNNHVSKFTIELTDSQASAFREVIRNPVISSAQASSNFSSQTSSAPSSSASLQSPGYTAVIWESDQQS